jgi:hypothetical protein
MYLGEHCIDSEDISVIVHPKVQGQLIQDRIQQLLQKHKYSLAATDIQPTFFLEGVPSFINGFQSLMQQLTSVDSPSRLHTNRL